MANKKRLTILAATAAVASALVCTLAMANTGSRTGLPPDQERTYDNTAKPPADELDWSAVTTRIGEICPDDYAGSTVSAGKHLVAFKRAVPDQARAELSKFGADYVVLEHRGFSLKDVEDASSSIADLINREAPGTVYQIVPSALAPDLAVAIDPSSIPDISTGDADPSPVKIAVDPALALTEQESGRLQALASRVAGLSQVLHVSLVARQWDQKEPPPVVPPGTTGPAR